MTPSLRPKGLVLALSLGAIVASWATRARAGP